MTPEEKRAKWREACRRYRLVHHERIYEMNKKYRAAHPEKVREFSRRYLLKHPDRMREYQRKHPEKINALARKWRTENPEKVSEMNRKWREANRDRTREASKKYYSRHPEACALRRAVTHMMRYAECRKSALSCQYVGCSTGFFRSHIESLFQPGMTWENWGEWHVDHIVPLARWDFYKHPEHLYAASHYSNLRPMWARENISKGARLVAAAQEVV